MRDGLKYFFINEAFFVGHQVISNSFDPSLSIYDSLENEILLDLRVHCCSESEETHRVALSVAKRREMC